MISAAEKMAIGARRNKNGRITGTRSQGDINMKRTFMMMAPALVLACAAVSAHPVKLDKQLNPAPSVLPTTLYPWGADNGEQIWENTGPATIQYAPISVSSAGSPGTIVAGVAGQQIRVLGYYFTNTVAGTVTFDSGSTPLTGAMTTTANESLNIPVTKFGCFETTAGAALNLVITGASNQVSGYVVYVQH